ncbi:hypothetical protein D9M71_367810 [compost metagenome]
MGVLIPLGEIAMAGQVLAVLSSIHVVQAGVRGCAAQNCKQERNSGGGKSAVHGFILLWVAPAVGVA